MYYIGIDPGKAGYIAIINEHRQFIDSAMFNEQNYRELLYKYKDNSFAVLERVFSSPQMGVRSAFSFGENFGFIRGILTSFCIPHELVLPRKWKNCFGITADKNTSIMCAQRLFPDVDLRATTKCKKPHDGKAEALLMAEYAKRIVV